MEIHISKDQTFSNLTLSRHLPGPAPLKTGNALLPGGNVKASVHEIRFKLEARIRSLLAKVANMASVQKYYEENYN